MDKHAASPSVASSQFTAAAIVCAADPNYVHSAGLAPHSVSKLYYTVVTKQWLEVYQAIFGAVVMHIDGCSIWALLLETCP